MARFVSKEDFGTMAIVSSLISFGVVFTEGGMGPAIIQKEIVTKKHISTAISTSAIIGLLAYLLLFLSKDAIANFYDQSILRIIIPVIGLNFVFLSLSSVSLSLLHKNFQFKYASIATVFASTISYIIGIYLAFHNYGIWALVIASLLYAFFRTILYILFSRISLSFKFSVTEWKELFSFGSGMILIKVINFLSSSGLKLMLGKVLTTSLLGFLDRALYIRGIPNVYLGHVIDRIIFPLLSRLQKEKEKAMQVFEFGLGLSLSFMLPLSFFLTLNVQEIVLILLGQEWDPIYLPLQILFISIPLNMASRIVDVLLRSLGLVHKNAQRKCIYAIILLSSSFIGAKIYGLEGVAVAIVISSFLNFLLAILVVQNHFQISLYNLLKKPIIISLSLGIALFVLTIVLWFFAKSMSNLWLVQFLIVCSLDGVFLITILIKKPMLLGTYIYQAKNHFLKRS